METIHFTKQGELFHVSYTRKKGRYGDTVKKVYGSECKCDCENRAADRKALEAIRSN